VARCGIDQGGVKLEVRSAQDLDGRMITAYGNALAQLAGALGPIFTW
jgi:hypothetical protein